MAMTVRNVMASVPAALQQKGLTLGQIRKQFMMAGYGPTKVEKRTKELLESAQIQSDGRKDENGSMLFFCIYWPNSGMKCDMDRVASYYYEDHNHTILVRRDGRKQAWFLEQNLNA